MKKIIYLLAIVIVALGLSGCLDPQDDSGGKLPAKKVTSNVHL
jgi:hypothetical protein